MRVLVLSWEFPPHVVGGLGKHVVDLVPALARHGIEVHVVTPMLSGGDPTETIAPGVTIHRVPTAAQSPDQSIVVFSQASNSALEHKAHELRAQLGGFDLIHGHDWLVAYSSVALKYALKLPLVVTVHSMERGRMQGALRSDESLAINGAEWWLTNEAWRVITVSNYMARQVQDFFNVPRDKLDVIYNGVVVPDRTPLSDDERATFRAQFAQPDEPIIYYVGRIVHEKGVQVLVNSAPQILRHLPRARFVIAGTGAYLEAVRSLAQQRGLLDRFTFTGFVSDEVRDKLYDVADVTVIPSLYEPFGIVALEAMAYGCPVVVAQTGGLAEVVRPHETGILTTPGDPQSLAWGILHTLQQPEWGARRAENALNDVRMIYNWDRIAQQTQQTYARVLHDWRQSGGARIGRDPSPAGRNR